jgi:hypothetical protein
MFQMSVTQCGVCCKTFNRNIPFLFGETFNRSPSASDLTAISALHKRVHGVDGMLGSLDCMHTYWKNCPVAWQQSFRGKEKMASIVLEAGADYNLWFWHASYGYAGALNDYTIVNLSPLLQKLTDGSFTDMEEATGVIPFTVGDESFHRTFFLVDGIYPKYARFVRGLKEPSFDEETRFTAWQESARKDIERAFGVLQGKWKAIANPIHSMDMKAITNLVGTCLILHNMAVSDRVMGDVNAVYVPSTVAPPEHPSCNEATTPTTLSSGLNVSFPQPSVATLPPTAARAAQLRINRVVAERKEWKILKDPTEWARLQRALIAFKGREASTTNET